jgi:hypothetical protein
VINNLHVAGNPYIAARVDPSVKERFATLARQQGLSESQLLKRLVETAVTGTRSETPVQLGAVSPPPTTGKISVRLRSDDLLLLRERAQNRQMPTGTFVSLLIRSHLRRLTPPADLGAAGSQRERGPGGCGRSHSQSHCPCTESWRDDLWSRSRGSSGAPDWCSARIDFDFQQKQLITLCQDNGVLIMQFENNVWPMPQSTPSNEQNN